MRTWLIAVTLVAGCGSTAPYHPQSLAKAAPLKTTAPHDSAEMARTGQSLERPPASLPQDTADTASTPHQQNIGPVRDIPPAPIVP
jgi:hypothetical protein